MQDENKLSATDIDLSYPGSILIVSSNLPGPSDAQSFTSLELANRYSHQFNGNKSF